MFIIKVRAITGIFIKFIGDFFQYMLLLIEVGETRNKHYWALATFYLKIIKSQLFFI